MIENQHLFSEDNFFFNHLLKHHQKYLFLLLIIIISSCFYFNYLSGKPLIMGTESYYHLSLAQESRWNNFLPINLFHFPLHLALNILPESFLFLLPLFLACTSFFLFIYLAKKMKISPLFLLFFLTAVIISPTFIFAFTTLSAYSFFLFLALCGYCFLWQENKWSWLSLFFFAYATLVDLLSSLLLLFSLMIYFAYSKPKENIPLTPKNKKNILTSTLFIVIISLLLLNWLIFHQPLVLGPFHSQQTITDLISDLGGLSGISFSLLLLSILGAIFNWRKKTTFPLYCFLIFLLPVYIYSTQTIFYLSVILLLFAALGFNTLFQNQWKLETLKKFTFLLIILSFAFSTLNYLGRVNLIGPTDGDFQALTWIKENTNENEIIFSAPEEGYFIRYFARRPPFYQYHLAEEKALNTTKIIFASTYSSKTFPLLQENNLSIMYITPSIRNNYPAEQGLLFLIKNERFKLIHSYRDYQVWTFTEGLN